MADPTAPIDTPPEDEPAAPADPPTDPPTEDEPLRPEGVKALEAWKQRAKDAEADAKRAKDLEAELEELRRSQMSDQERAIAEARDAARSEALGEVNSRLFAAEVRASAAGKITDPDLLSDPDVALKLLGFDTIPVTDDGQIDASAIGAAVGQLIESRPYLKADATPAPPSNPGLGPQGGPADPPTINEQIADAEREGRWDEARRLKNQQLLAARPKR